MLIRSLVLAATLVAPTASLADLADALQIPRVVEVMRAEGLQQGERIASDLMPGRDTAGWQIRLERIYDAPLMEDRLADALGEAMEDDVEADVVAFFEGELGARIIDLELDAREAIIDEGAEDAAIAAWEDISTDEPERAALIDEFIAVNGLIEENVQGGLNSNLNFMLGMNEAGAFDPPLDEGTMLSDIWAQEAEIRQETTDWLRGYLGLAYAPLTEDELQRYVDFSASDTGQAFNRALFEAFDVMYDGVTYELGRTAAIMMMGEDI